MTALLAELELTVYNFQVTQKKPTQKTKCTKKQNPIVTNREKERAREVKPCDAHTARE